MQYVTHNHCRNPDKDEFGPWCFVGTGKGIDNFGYCRISRCSPDGSPVSSPDSSPDIILDSSPISGRSSGVLIPAGNISSQPTMTTSTIKITTTTTTTTTSTTTSTTTATTTTTTTSTTTTTVITTTTEIPITEILITEIPITATTLMLKTTTKATHAATAVNSKQRDPDVSVNITGGRIVY